MMGLDYKLYQNRSLVMFMIMFKKNEWVCALVASFNCQKKLLCFWKYLSLHLVKLSYLKQRQLKELVPYAKK